jgi:hypothetical protein
MLTTTDSCWLARKPKSRSACKWSSAGFWRALRKPRFFSLHELNAAIGELLTELNAKPFKKLAGSRASCFEALERPALEPLPSSRSAHQRQQRGDLVQAQTRSQPREGKQTRQLRHSPRAYAGGPPRACAVVASKLIARGERVGPATGKLIERLLAEQPHPEMGYRAVLGLMRLAREHGNPRLEAACERALAIGAPRYKSVASILKAKLESAPTQADASEWTSPMHAHVRGPTITTNPYRRAPHDDATHPEP